MIVQHLNKIAFHFSFDYIFSQLYFDLIQIIANKIFPPFQVCTLFMGRCCCTFGMFLMRKGTVILV